MTTMHPRRRRIAGLATGAWTVRAMVRVLAFSIAFGISPTAASGQQARLARADSALVGRILLAEDRRDSTDRAITDGLAHRDARIRTLAWRARERIRDARFVARDSLPPLAAPPSWPEPAWRLRYRSLATWRNDCGALRAALADESWPVRFRAAGFVTGACADDAGLVTTLRQWVDALPADVTRRAAGGVSWHAAAHGIVALSKVRPEEARPRLATLASHPQWQLRMYSARAAASLADTATLRTLARDANDNVKEVAIEALAALTGHADDDIYVAALRSEGAQAVRAAATALKGSAHPEARAAASAVLERWAARGRQTDRDVRVALLEAAGRPAGDDRPPPAQHALPPAAIGLALGDDVRLRVTMSPASGGGSFVVRLRGDVAPVMAARILELARAGYYDGLTWHRVEHDFVVQGGSPGANEYVGHADYIRDDLGTVPHVRGTVGMSTRGHDTGDAQWFINLRDNARLGRDYSVFAEVVEGMDVVDGILEGDVISSITVVRRP